MRSESLAQKQSDD